MGKRKKGEEKRSNKENKLLADITRPFFTCPLTS